MHGFLEVEEEVSAIFHVRFSIGSAHVASGVQASERRKTGPMMIWGARYARAGNQRRIEKSSRWCVHLRSPTRHPHSLGPENHIDIIKKRITKLRIKLLINVTAEKCTKSNSTNVMKQIKSPIKYGSFNLNLSLKETPRKACLRDSFLFLNSSIPIVRYSTIILRLLQAANPLPTNQDKPTKNNIEENKTSKSAIIMTMGISRHKIQALYPHLSTTYLTRLFHSSSHPKSLTQILVVKRSNATPNEERKKLRRN